MKYQHVQIEDNHKLPVVFGLLHLLLTVSVVVDDQTDMDNALALRAMGFPIEFEKPDEDDMISINLTGKKKKARKLIARIMVEFDHNQHDAEYWQKELLEAWDLNEGLPAFELSDAA